MSSSPALALALSASLLPVVITTYNSSKKLASSMRIWDYIQIVFICKDVPSSFSTSSPLWTFEPTLKFFNLQDIFFPNCKMYLSQ